MNILVYNVAAEYAGALEILKEFYDSVKKYDDRSIHWFFIVTTDILISTEHITVIRVPHVKKSWLRRWKYDTFVVQKLIKKLEIDGIFSMQNMSINRCRLKQVVYMHQSLQFSPKRYSFLKKTERIYAVRKYILGTLLKGSLKRADKIIVQSSWIKNACMEWLKVNEERFEIIPPKVSFSKDIMYRVEFGTNHFFYPAGGGNHKNHKRIVDACILLKRAGIENYDVTFTLNEKDNIYSHEVYESFNAEELPINFVGIIPKTEVEDLYERSIVLYPSYLETFGLPLLEAKLAGCIVIASDLPYAHEILDDYPNAYYFEYEDSYKLANLMKNCITGNIQYYPYIYKSSVVDNYNLIDSILKLWT